MTTALLWFAATYLLAINLATFVGFATDKHRARTNGRRTPERSLLILAAGDPDSEISASMLPAEIGTLVPATPNGTGGEKLMSLPLREAREVFEREYLVAQINRFGDNISRTAEFIGMERSALHRKLKSLGID